MSCKLIAFTGTGVCSIVGLFNGRVIGSDFSIRISVGDRHVVGIVIVGVSVGSDFVSVIVGL